MVNYPADRDCLVVAVGLIGSKDPADRVFFGIQGRRAY